MTLLRRTVCAWLPLLSAVDWAIAGPTAPPPSAFLGLAWGAAPPGTAVQLGSTTKDGLATYRAGGPPPLWEGIESYEAAFLFERRKLYSGMVYFRGAERFEQVKRTLTQKYGPPQFANAQKQIFKWKWPKRFGISLWFDSGKGTGTLSLGPDD